MGSITLNEKQQRRADILSRLASGRVTKRQAGELLGVSDRHIRRMLADFRSEGVSSVPHGNSGRASSSKTDDDIVERIICLAKEGGKYHGFNACHLTDLLREAEGIPIGRSTLDRILRDNHITVSRKRRSGTRKRRERSSAEGSMLQIDGSPHDWLMGRGSRMCLIGAVDDATGRIIYAQFRPTEDLIGYLMMLRSIVQTHGLPASLYHDKHTILRSPGRVTIEDELAGKEPQSQFQRVMGELGIESIVAHSPQAKGRIERTWGVLQDRLVKEMRLRNISDIDEANAFLHEFVPRYNERFGVNPADGESAWIAIDATMDMDYYFCVREVRTVRNDYTIAWGGKIVQLMPRRDERVVAGARVNVHITPEGSLHVYDGKRRLSHRIIEARPQSVDNPPARGSEPKPTDPEKLANRRAWLYSDIRKIA